MINNSSAVNGGWPRLSTAGRDEHRLTQIMVREDMSFGAELIIMRSRILFSEFVRAD